MYFFFLFFPQSQSVQYFFVGFCMKNKMPLQKIYNNNQLLMLLCCGGVCVWIIMVRMTNRKWQAAAKPAWNFLEAPAPLQQVWVISSCFVGGGLVWCKGFCFAFSYFFRKKIDLTWLSYLYYYDDEDDHHDDE